MKYIAVLCIVVSLGLANIHRHGSAHYFAPERHQNATMVSFSNGITFDTRAGEPILPTHLTIKQYNGLGYYLVQLTGPINDGWKQNISMSGGEIVGYIPYYTLIIRAEASSIDEIGQESFVNWTGIFQPAYKMPRDLFFAQGEERIIIQVFANEDVHSIAQNIEDLGFRIDYIADHHLSKSIDATGDLSELSNIAAYPGVAWIQLWSPIETCNDQCQWVVQTGWCSATPGNEGWRIWNEGLRGQGIVLSTSDTGINTDHIVYFDPSCPITGPGVFPNHRKIVAYKLFSTAHFGDDTSYHGTHVNCTLAGDDSINGGLDPYDGMAKDARIYFLDLFDSLGNLVNGSWLEGLDTLYYGGGLPYHILQHSGSWGIFNYIGTYTIYDAIIDGYVWSHRDFLHLFAAGNEDTNRTIRNPGIAKNVITIGATQNGCCSNCIAGFSSRGPTQDGRIKPTIMAPGVSLMSADGATNYGYQTMSGTSMATPAANGSVGLIRQYLLAGFYPSGTANPADSIHYQSAALLRTLTIVSADPNIDTYVVPDSNIGWGRIDIDSVLHFTGDTRKLIILDDTIGIGTGQAVTDSFRVLSSIPLKICLAWTDTAAAPNANPTLVNDLNLELTAPDGTIFRGNKYSGGQSIPNPSDWDHVNVEECCRINEPQTGVWHVTVGGQQVVFGPQPYAYAITGDITPETGILEGRLELPKNKTSFHVLGSVTNGLITFEIVLPGQTEVEVSLFDITGRKIETLCHGKLPAGKNVTTHHLDLPNGAYFLRFEADDYEETHKLLFIK